ncbi:SWI/SNF complex subunit SWI3B [Prunus yedoensis var. nudiflora]|uniref:SWI/SNF complex subunit SWI3B n=1 Tax=Prunus yedoensis var. nudiflora TaxID=2094558 RepID=A0A314UDM5_PRUYE|nr:SWI/SNF complex subunit SWI3B [Prunus yedoensis var. nudiflora]
MTTKSVVQDFSSDTRSRPNPSPISVKPETPATPRPPQPPANSDVHIVHVPSYSRWFSWDHIHHCEVRFLPEFFDSHSPSKNPRLYMYYRNNIIKHYRDNPARKLTFTDARKTLVGDVGSIRRVFDFLEVWGLINYSSSALNKPLRWEDKDSKAASPVAESPQIVLRTLPLPTRRAPRRECAMVARQLACSSALALAVALHVTFYLIVVPGTDLFIPCWYQYDMTLCARCYVRGNYQMGVTSSDFRRVEINEEMRSDWAYKDTLHLLEALMHYGDDWRKVAQHVGRSEKECITHFIKIPFGEEFIADFDSGNFDYKNSSPLKEYASNPIMAQAAFLSALAGVEVAKAAACAAITTLGEADYETSRLSLGSWACNTRHHEANAESNGDTNLDEMGGAFVDANSQLEKEGMDVERAFLGLQRCKVLQMKEIQEKIVRFEELDLQMEKERQKLEQMKNMLFVDKLTLSIHKTCAQKTEEWRKIQQIDFP